MKIKDLLIGSNTIIPRNNNSYNSDLWFLNTAASLDGFLRRLHGNREIYDDLLEYNSAHHEDPDGTRQNVMDMVDAHLALNAYKYRHLWDLYVAEYNPLWNVDGSEKIIRDRSNTGTQDMQASGHDELTKSGTEQNSRSGNDSVTKSGSESETKSGNDTTTRNGSVEDQNGGAITTDRTTFDSSTFLGIEQKGDTTEKTTTYTNLADETDYNSDVTTSFTNRKDQTDYNSSETLSFTNRKDKTDYGRKDTRTDNLNEHEVIEHIRGGNIGVTMTTQLEEGELAWALRFRLLEMICADIANAISYVW